MKSEKISAFSYLISILMISLWMVSCTHKADITELPEVCFEGDILPIFLNSCAISGCHDSQYGGEESKMVLNNYLDISHAVVPGDPSASRIYTAITATMGENKMPPDQPLSLENRTLIRIWIEQGARLTICPGTTASGGAGGTPDEPYINPRACFTRDILPVLVSRCATTGCHDAVTHEEGYIFASYTTAMRVVRPGNPAESKLYEVIMRTSGEEKMPPADRPQLTGAEIDSIRQWIAYGALNENCGEICDTINPVTFSGTIWPLIQTTCTGCHSGSSPSGNTSLASYNNVAALASSGLLIKALYGDGVTRMPPAGTFSACRIRQFEIWVNNGFLNN